MRISIIGLGMMGSSLGLAIRKAQPGWRVAGFDNSAAQAAVAVQRGCVHETFTDVAEAVADAELVVLAVPIGSIATALPASVAGMPPGALVTDICSTKRTVVSLVRRVVKSGVSYVGSHPMVGAEHSGAQHARGELFNGGLALITIEPDTNAAAARRIESFWQQLGMRTRRLTALQHDTLAAAVSHLPHTLAAALIRVQDPAGLEIAGTGFRDMTRIAAGQPQLWRDILLDNADQLRAAIGQLRGELDELDRLLDPRHASDLEAWLGAAAAARRRMDGDGSAGGPHGGTTR